MIKMKVIWYYICNDDLRYKSFCRIISKLLISLQQLYKQCTVNNCHRNSGHFTRKSWTPSSRVQRISWPTWSPSVSLHLITKCLSASDHQVLLCIWSPSAALHLITKCFSASDLQVLLCIWLASASLYLITKCFSAFDQQVINASDHQVLLCIWSPNASCIWSPSASLLLCIWSPRASLHVFTKCFSVSDHQVLLCICSPQMQQARF